MDCQAKQKKGIKKKSFFDSYEFLNFFTGDAFESPSSAMQRKQKIRCNGKDFILLRP